MKEKLKDVVRKWLIISTRNYQKKYILDIMKANGFLNKECKGEKEFLDKWKRLEPKVDPVYYRCFYNYVGEKSDIISGDICVNCIEPILNPVQYKYFYEDKNIYNKLLPSIRMPYTILRKINGVYCDADYNIVTIDSEKLSELVKGYNSFILKPSVNSCSGDKVSLFHKEKENFIDQHNQMFSLAFLERKYGDNLIIQECLKQSNYLAQFNETSLNTIRIAAYRSVKDDSIHLTNAMLRIGASGSVVDNAHAGGKFCGIDKNGNLNHYVSDTLGRRTSCFNGVDFSASNFSIPNYNTIVNFVKEIVPNIYHHRLIALDIALNDNDQPVLIEYNIGGFGYWPFQMCGQITLDGYTDEIIEFCFNHDKTAIVSTKF